MLSQGRQQPCTDAKCALQRVRVLVVDDNRDIVHACAKMLQSAGFEVRTAPDGFGALRIAAEFHPHITLLDIGLPDIDGYEVARRLRSDNTLRAMTIIAISGYGDEEARQQAKAIGFNHYLVKPVTFTELRPLLVAGL
jgi:DNA-binding response OmpR family regulator